MRAVAAADVTLPDELHPEMRAIVEMMAATPLPALSTLSPPAARAQDAAHYDAFWNADPPTLPAVTEHRVPGGDGTIAGNVTLSATAATNRVSRITGGDIGSIGSLNIGGTLDLGAGSVSYFDITNMSSYDQIVVTAGAQSLAPKDLFVADQGAQLFDSEAGEGGTRAGAFDIRMAAGLSFGYDSNVYATDGDELGEALAIGEALVRARNRSATRTTNDATGRYIATRRHIATHHIATHRNRNTPRRNNVALLPSGPARRKWPHSPSFGP